ncbi:hypothetical protein EV1_028303 [Malus domestica]
MGLVGASHVVRSAQLGAVVSHNDRSRAAGNHEVGRHGCERRAEAGLGQVVRNKRNWTTGFVMLGYW